MDERHWWIAGKIQESFHVGSLDNPTLLEDFICEAETLQLVNDFLGSNGPCRLFFYCDKVESGNISTKNLHILSSLGILKDVPLEEVTILYFLRHDTTREVDGSHMEKDVYSGELKGNTIESMNSLFSEIYIPLLKSQREWGTCSEESQNSLMNNMEKFLTALSESAASSHTSKQLMLRQPESTISNDFKMHRLAALDQQLITEYEKLVSDWISTIEAVLTDTTDERFLDPTAGPLSELERWRRRQRLLTSITEQLKGKECKAVMGVLVTAKSRLLKKWKSIDVCITDAMNETKDKVKYLESLKRHLDQLYHGATPSSIMNTALPGLLNAVKQMDSISRFYARSGFLGLLFAKVTNQLVQACKDYIAECSIDDEGADLLWERVNEEILLREQNLSSDPQDRHLRSQVEAKLRGLKGKAKDGKERNEEEMLIGRMRGCLTLQSYYREAVRSLKDALGASHMLSHFTSLSSLATGSVTNRSKQGSVGGATKQSQSPSKKTLSQGDGHGISIADEQTIMAHMDLYCNRLREIMDVVSTLSQFSKMVKTTNGLPRPRPEDIVSDEPEGTSKAVTGEAGTSGEVNVTHTVHRERSSLGAIAEAEESSVDTEVTGQDTDGAASEKTDQQKAEFTQDIHDVMAQRGLTREDVVLLKQYYPDDLSGEGPSVRSIVKQYMQQIGGIMRSNISTRTMMDVESKDKDRFTETYNNFQGVVVEMEQFLAAYLHAIFMRKMKTQEALDLINRFVPVQQRPGVRAVIAEKFIEIFNWYEGDLDEIQKLYEKYKEDPPKLRNAPPVAGAISWSRQLLKRIEDPMKVFRDNKAITQLKDFSRIVRIYNRLATALVTFESLWFTQWRNNIDQAREGLRATLFVSDPGSKQIVVNADERILELIHEAKWLTRLDIQVPDVAVAVMQQESRFKHYKDHLELVLREYREVCDQIPPALWELFVPHMSAAEQNFSPGLSTLAWNSMNIDAFLHQIHSGTAKLKFLVDKVNEVMDTKVKATISRISDMLFFDYKLAFSRSWPPNKFTNAMLESIKFKSSELLSHIGIIESGIRDVANMLSIKKISSFSSLQNVFSVAQKWKKRAKQKNMEKERNMVDVQSSLSNRGKKNTSVPHTPAQHRNPEEENTVRNLLSHYADHLYAAIRMATMRSLVTLAEACGCDGEVVRSVSSMSHSTRSDSSSSTPRTPEPEVTAQTIAQAEQRAVSTLSLLSDMTWTTEKADHVTYLQFEVQVNFNIPSIIVEPPLDSIQQAINTVASSITNIGVGWLQSMNLGENFVNKATNDDVMDELIGQIGTVVEDLERAVKEHLFHFGMYDFLWKDDMCGNYKEFIEHDPGTFAIKREVERLLRIEQKVLSIPQVLPVGPICLHTSPITNALHGFAMAWKTQYASVLHEEAKKNLDAAVLYRSNVRSRLELSVVNLDQLNSTLHLLEELRDMENKIDDIYLPIETMYAKLREFELRLPRSEVEEVDNLRDNWTELLLMADEVSHVLLKERRGAFEQELDKQVKTFVVEVIQFRNAFDAQGPAVPGILPEEAVERLQNFQQRYSIYDSKRKTLVSVSRLFGIPIKPFPELDKTGEELELLGMLYGLFQKFIRFDSQFRDTLWAEADLDSATREVESYWDECLALPSKLKDWDAYNDMKGSIQLYLDVFPLLHKLAAKEIRNRHWLQVMSVTGSSFQLEANIFKLHHLLDIGLIKHRMEIEEICYCASREQELEVKMRVTEEEWTEQVLNFEPYKKRGPMYLDKSFTERLLEQLEDAQALLAQMLVSKHIGPLREEAASWAEKLKEVAQVLELWLEVQDLWQYLEAVFSNSHTAKELPQEAKRFGRIDKGWTKMMKRAFETKNVLQCCYGGEVPKAVVLRHIYEELEVCFKSLMGYLDNKRRNFPRFYFVSDPVLLAMLSRPNDLESVKPYLRCIFTSIFDVKLEKSSLSDSEVNLNDPHSNSRTPTDRGRTSSVQSGHASPHLSSNTPVAARIDKRLTAIHQFPGKDDKQGSRKSVRENRTSGNINPSALTQHVSAFLPSEGLLEETVTMDAVAVQSLEGEVLPLNEKVALTEGVEVWLQNLQECVRGTLHDMLFRVIQDANTGVPCEEWAAKYPAQICRLGMLYYWTRECEQGVADIKYDRKSMNNTSRRFASTVSKLPAILMRGAWRGLDEAMLPMHKLRLESMITQSLFLRDSIDYMANRKLREPTDFEWRRNMRLYVHDIDDRMEPVLYIMDSRYFYGCEFYGAQPVVAMTPLTERCYLSMTQALTQHMGTNIIGGTGVGKTETVKGLAQLLGFHLSIFQCSATADHTSLGKMLQGLAMDGCWACFDDIQSLQREPLSVLVDHCQAIFGALKAKQEYCYVGDGQEIFVNKDTAVFVTTNLSRAPPGYEVPCDIKALFRHVSLVKPDVALVLKAKCSALGLKAPTVLSARLKIIIELAKDQLPQEFHHHLSLSSLTGVLQRAAQKRRFIREEKSMEKSNSMLQDRSKEESSRSNSQQSVAPNSNPNAQLQHTASSTLLMTSVSGQRGIQSGSGIVAASRKAGTPNPLSIAAKMEHALVAHMMMEIIGPRLTPECFGIFRHIVKDMFAGLPDAPSSLTSTSARSRTVDMETAMESTAQERGLVAHKPWIEKCMQLYTVSSIHQGVIVAGPPGSGKSCCIQTLVDALCVVPRGIGSRQSRSTRASEPSESNHKLQKINPLVVDDLSLMFGHLNQSHDWVDGIFTSAWRKANRNQSTTWLCLDGPLTSSWADNFTSVLDSSRVLQLLNGDKLYLSDNVKLLFETDDLSKASPAIVARAGIVYVDKVVLGWRPLAKAWLDSRSQQEVHVLSRAFDKTVDPVAHFVMNDCRPKLRLCEVGMFQTCLNLLSAMLADNIEIGGELHIERLYLFCLIWAYGGLLEERDRKAFSDLLKTLSTALPDDDRDICVFDYYVDESGEWDPWQSRVPEAVYTDSQDMLGEVFIDTVDTVRTRIFMEFASASGQNVLLVGPPGCGKTSLINDFIDMQDQQPLVSKRLVYSGASSAKQLHQFVESNIYHRQGLVYGAKENKRLQVFIDDLNLPVPDEHGVQRCNELLRQLLDDKVLCTQQRPFEVRCIEGLVIFSAMGLSEYSSTSYRGLADRLLRHFCVFHLPSAQPEALKNIVKGILEANMSHNDKLGLDIELHAKLVQSSCDLLTKVCDVLRPSPMPGRHHYLFTLRDIVTSFQCLKRLSDEGREDEGMVVSLWKHELMCIIRDRICRTADSNWFDKTLNDIVKEKWPQLEGTLHEFFVTFPIDSRSYQRPVTSVSKKEVKVVLQPVQNLGEIHNCLYEHLKRYNEEFGNIQLNIMLSDYILGHLVRMHRILSFHHSGNFLCIGAVGTHLGTLCKLALHVAEIPIHVMDTSKRNTFLDGLRSAVRLSGSEGKLLTLFFTGRDLEDTLYLDAINSLLVCGEYPHLFSNDEMDGLLQAIMPALKREFPSGNADPMKYFVSRLKKNLHIIIALPPTHRLLQIAASEYPGLLTGCQLLWMCDWPQSSLLTEAKYYISSTNLLNDIHDKYAESVTTVMANIHKFVLHDCRQMPWAGEQTEEVTLTQVKVNEKKKDLIKVQTLKLPNLPYSKSIILEQIKLQHRDLNVPARNEVFIGPNTYRRFMDTFHFLYQQKSKERTETVTRLKKVLATLDQTRTDARIMKENIRNIREKYEGSKKKTATLLKQLTMRATVLEKLKAKVGEATSLSAFLQLNELSSDEEDEDDLLKPEEEDEYDKEFERMREANMKTRQVQVKEEYENAQKTVEQCRKDLQYAREQVLHWKSRVDRQCIERLKNFQNPPMLVGQVMEMVMILIGKRLPSQRLTTMDGYPAKEDHSGRMSQSSSSTKFTTVTKRMSMQSDRRRGLPSNAARSMHSFDGRTPSTYKPGEKGSERFDRSQWKSMQITMTDATKFVDMLHNVSWEDGLSQDVLMGVESYLTKSRDGQLGVTGEGTLLENASDAEKSFKATRRSPSPDNTRGITIAAAKFSSEDAATLVQYTIAIVEYTRLCGPLKGALERVHELEREIEENERQQRERENQPQDEEKEDLIMPEEDLSEDDLPRVQREVDDLQTQFDASVVEKHSLEIELVSMNERLKAASSMVESMKVQESGWRRHVKEFATNDVLIANCVTAASFFTYCGPMNVDTRKRMGEFFMLVCEHHGIPMPTKKLFKDMQLFDFMYKQMKQRQLQQLGLPYSTRLMLENACFIMEEDMGTAWPLLCDSTNSVIDWLKCYLKDKHIVEVRYHELRSQLETCLAEGTPLLVSDCNMKELVHDARFADIILRRNKFVKGKTSVKIMVGDHEVECQPHFRMYLHTTTDPHMVPAEISSYMSVIYFHQSRHDIEEQLLDRFMMLEKSRLADEQTALLQERLENMQFLSRIEENILKDLSSDVRLMNDLAATKKLTELKKQYDETVDSQSRVESSEASILRARESYRAIAQRGAVCFETSIHLREVNALYQTSTNQFLEIYDAAISHSERAAIKAVVERLTQSSFVTVARSLVERDRQMYALLLAIEVEDSLGNIGPGEREFLITPHLGAVTMQSLGIVQSQDSKFVQAKKPFDWMLDEQFSNLQMLAVHFEWFQEMFDRMPRDGRETQWRNLCESDMPEAQPLPDKMDDVYSPMQRLLVIRAVRSDRLLQASTIFTTSVLGKKYCAEVGIDLPLMLKQSCPAKPIVLLYERKGDTAERLFSEFAGKKQNKTLLVALTSNSVSEERQARKFIHKAMSEGLWVLLQNAHNAPHLLAGLEALMSEQTSVDSQFRCWVTAQAGKDIPIRILQNSVKVMVDSPKVMKDNLIRAFSMIDADMLKQSSRPEWPALLHNLCYLHGAVQLRARFGRGGWNCPTDLQDIGANEQLEGLKTAVAEFSDSLMTTAPDGSLVPRNISWTGIRYVLTELVYGSYVTDPCDQLALGAMVDYWISPNAVKKDFELARLRYRLPAAFYSGHVTLAGLIKALEGIPNHFLDVPEACNIHPSVETLHGDDQYVFTRLNKVYDSMPSSQTLSHKLFPRPPTPFNGPPAAAISTSSNNPHVVDMGVFASASYAATKMRKEVELWEICHTILPKLPKVYSKEFITEKVKKIGGFTVFNLFIMKEMDIMFALITDMKTTLQAIKSAVEVSSLGDVLSSRLVSAADDLYHQRIPAIWRHMAGTSAPPANMSLANWLLDLQSRCQHFEKILMLGREKMPAYWLGAFFYPRGLLALVKQEAHVHHSRDRSGNVDNYVFQTEVTARDKDHLRDPPQEGMFVYGIYIWGCAWEKTTGELLDAPPRHACTALPVVHLTCWPQAEKPLLQDSIRAAEIYPCPVYPSRLADREPILEIDVRHDNIPSVRWALRGLCGTVRPY